MKTLSGIKDVDSIIINQLNDYELGKVSQVNKYVNSICNDDTFWRNRTFEKFGNRLKELDIDIRDYNKSNWREYYVLLSTIVKQIGKHIDMDVPVDKILGFSYITRLGGPRNEITSTRSMDFNLENVKLYKLFISDYDPGTVNRIYNPKYNEILKNKGYIMKDYIILDRLDLKTLAFLTTKYNRMFLEYLKSKNFNKSDELLNNILINPNIYFSGDLFKSDVEIYKYLIEKSKIDTRIDPASYNNNAINTAENFEEIQVLLSDQRVDPNFLIFRTIDSHENLLTENEFKMILSDSRITLKILLKSIVYARKPIRDNYKEPIENKLKQLNVTKKQLKNSKKKAYSKTNAKFLKIIQKRI